MNVMISDAKSVLHGHPTAQRSFQPATPCLPERHRYRSQSPCTSYPRLPRFSTIWEQAEGQEQRSAIVAWRPLVQNLLFTAGAFDHVNGSLNQTVFIVTHVIVT